jgi:hypothetical protein
MVRQAMSVNQEKPAERQPGYNRVLSAPVLSGALVRSRLSQELITDRKLPDPLARRGEHRIG